MKRSSEKNKLIQIVDTLKNSIVNRTITIPMRFLLRQRSGIFHYNNISFLLRDKKPTRCTTRKWVFKWSVIIFLISNFQVAYRVFLFKGDLCLVAQNFILNLNVNNEFKLQYNIWYPNTQNTWLLPF